MLSDKKSPLVFSCTIPFALSSKHGRTFIETAAEHLPSDCLGRCK